MHTRGQASTDRRGELLLGGLPGRTSRQAEQQRSMVLEGFGALAVALTRSVTTPA